MQLKKTTEETTRLPRDVFTSLDELVHLVCLWWRSACKCHLWLLLEILPWTPRHKHRPPSHLCGSVAKESRCIMGHLSVERARRLRAGPGQLTSECPCVKKNLLTFLLSGLALVAKCLKYLGPKSGWWWRKMSTIWVTTQRGCCGISRERRRRRCETMRGRFLVCLYLVATHGLDPRMSSWPCQLVKNKLLNGALFDLWPPWFVWGQRRSNAL